MIREQKANVNTLDIGVVQTTQTGKKWERRTEKIGGEGGLFLSLLNK